MLSKMFRLQAGRLQIVQCFFVLDPSFALPLRIDQQWIAFRSRDNNGVLNGEFIVGKTLQLPFADDGDIGQILGDIQGASKGNIAFG